MDIEKEKPKMKNEQVSVLVPLFNKEKYVGEFLQSILIQTYLQLQVIFVDDGSTDGSKAVVDEYLPKLQDSGIEVVYISQRNAGVSAAINAGLKVVKGEYLIWPDADDILPPDSIRARVAFLQKNPEYGLVAGNIERLYEDGTKTLAYDMDKLGPSDLKSMIILEGMPVLTGLYMVRLSAFRDTNAEMKIYPSRTGQNLQMLVPVLSKYPCACIHDVVYIYRFAENSLSCKRKTYEQQLDDAKEFAKIQEWCVDKTGGQKELYEAVCISLHKACLRIADENGQAKPANMEYRWLRDHAALEAKDIVRFKRAHSKLYRLWDTGKTYWRYGIDYLKRKWK